MGLGGSSGRRLGGGCHLSRDTERLIKEAGFATESIDWYVRDPAGKEDVLRKAVDRELAHLDSLQQALDMLPLGDFRAELTFLARWNLSTLEQRSDLLAFLRRGAAFPELARGVHRRMTAQPLEQVAVLSLSTRRRSR